MGLKYFDSNVCVGQVGTKHRLQLWKTEDILAEIERTNISGALVYHGLSKVYAPVYGNERLLEELKKSERLFGCWAVMPNLIDDFYTEDELIYRMKENNIVAAKIFPKTHYYDPNERTIGKLLEALEEEGYPLFIDWAEIEFSKLEDILEGHPDLNIIFQGVYWGQERRLFSLMDYFPNLHIDFSSLQSNEIIEIAYERYGERRLLFGSNMPYKSPGAGRALIDYARIPESAKELIACGNLSRLIGVEPPDIKEYYPDEIVREAGSGKPLSISIYDSHTHLIEDGGTGGGGRPFLRGDIDNMIKAYRLLGIDKMSIAPWLGIEADSQEGNYISKRAIDKYPGEVLGYVTIDPNYVEDVGEEARRWHAEGGFKGMKPYYHISRIRYTAEIYRPWFELGNELRLYALLDPGSYSESEYLEDIETLAILYPNISIFMDHAGRSFEVAEKYAALAKKYKNVYLQLTYTTVTLGVIEYFVQEVGAKKVLFGTDSPMRDPRPQVGWLAYADISYEDKEAIFGGNMKEILERCLTLRRDGDEV